MIHVLLALLLIQATIQDELKEEQRLAKLLAKGNYAEVEGRYLAIVGFPQRKSPFLMSEMALAVNAAAQQGHCATLRKQLDLTNPQHLYLQAMLDAAAGNFTASRATMTRLLAVAEAEAGTHRVDLTDHASFLAFLDWAEGDTKASRRHDQLATETAEMTPVPMPFQNAITTATFADQARERGEKVKALKAWRDAVTQFERAGASGHAFLASSLDAQAKLLEEVGKSADASAARARAASIRSSRWCQ